MVEGVIDVCPTELKQTTVKLEPEKINALLGTELSEQVMRDILLRLGFTLKGDTIFVPSWRADVEHYSDIAEEVARFYGYNEIPTAFAGGQTTAGGYSERQQLERQIGACCRSMGLDEIITYSFISPSYYDKIRWSPDDPRRDSLRILNPLGEDTSIMRTTILPSITTATRRRPCTRSAASTSSARTAWPTSRASSRSAPTARRWTSSCSRAGSRRC